MKCFKDDDDGYLQWVKTNPNGFVVNTTRQPDPSYLILHRATCHSVTGTPAHGTKWTEDYIKICSLNRAELETCIILLLSGDIKPCKFCNP